MTDRDRETHIVTSGGGGGAGWLIAGILIAVVAIAGFFLYGGAFDGERGVNVSVEVPEAPDVEAPAIEAPEVDGPSTSGG